MSSALKTKPCHVDLYMQRGLVQSVCVCVCVCLCVCVCVCVLVQSHRIHFKLGWESGWVGSRPFQTAAFDWLLMPNGADPGLAASAVTSSRHGRWSRRDDVVMLRCHRGRADTVAPAHVLAIISNVDAHYHRGNRARHITHTPHLTCGWSLWIYRHKHVLFSLVYSGRYCTLQRV